MSDILYTHVQAAAISLSNYGTNKQLILSQHFPWK